MTNDNNNKTKNNSNNNMTTMKSIVYGPHNIPQWKECRKPRLPRSSSSPHVLIRVCAVGLNPVDAKGVIGDKLPHGWNTVQQWGQRWMVQSRVIGFDFAGIVEQVQQPPPHDASSSSSSLQPGDAVYGILPPSRYDGTLQEYLCVPLAQVAKLPSSRHHSLIQAAALPLVGLTAWQCLTGAGWTTAALSERRPKRLLVLWASGGTGHVAIQVGRCLIPESSNHGNDDATTIVAVCSERNRAFVQSLLVPPRRRRKDTTNDDTTNASGGIQSDENNNDNRFVVLDYHANDFVDQLRAHGPYDVVMDCVTSGDPRDQATINYEELLLSSDDDNENNQQRRPLLTPHAQYRRLGGGFTDWVRAGLERSTNLLKEQWLWPNPRAKLFWIQMHKNADDTLRQLSAWMEEGKMKGPHVSQTVPFTPDGIQQGFDALQGRHVVGKVVVEFPFLLEQQEEGKDEEKEDDEKESSQTKADS